MTDLRPTLIDRLLRRPPLDPLVVQQGRDDFLAHLHDNPYGPGTTAARSWQSGYDSVDDWNFVW